MASLPQGWESDYDGNRWFFRYKPTGAVQYMFPKEGDEFSVYCDNFWPVAQSVSPPLEERSERKYQLHDPHQSAYTTSSTTIRNGGNSSTSATLGRNEFLSASSFDMYGGFLGPASLSDVSPVDEDDVVPNMIATAAEDPTQRGIVEVASDPADSMPSKTKSSAEVLIGAAETASSVTPSIDVVEIHELPDTATLGGRHYASDPVGNISELATEQTLQCKDELAPAELDGGTIQIQPGSIEEVERLAREPNAVATETVMTSTPPPSTPVPSTAPAASPPLLPMSSDTQVQAKEIASDISADTARPNPGSNAQKGPDASPLIDRHTLSYHPLQFSSSSTGPTSTTCTPGNSLPSAPTTTTTPRDDTAPRPIVNAKLAAAEITSDCNSPPPHEQQRQATPESVHINNAAPAVISSCQLSSGQAAPSTQQTQSPAAPSALANRPQPPTSGQWDLNRVPSILQPASNRAARTQSLVTPKSESGLVLSDVPLVLRPANNKTTLSASQPADSSANSGKAKDISKLASGDLEQTNINQAFVAPSTTDKTSFPLPQSELVPAPLRLSRQASPSSPAPCESMSPIPNTPTTATIIVAPTSLDIMTADDVIPVPLRPRSPSLTHTSPSAFGILPPSGSLSQQESVASAALPSTVSPPTSGFLDETPPAIESPSTTQLHPDPGVVMSANFARIASAAPQSPLELPLASGPLCAPSVSDGDAASSNDQHRWPQASAATLVTPLPKSPPINAAPGMILPEQQKRISVVQRKAVGGAVATPAVSAKGTTSPRPVAAQSPQLADASGTPILSPSPASFMSSEASTTPHRPSVSSVSSQSSQSGGAFLLQRAPSATQSIQSDYRMPSQGTNTPQQFQPSPVSSVNSMYSSPVPGATLPQHAPTNAAAQPITNRMSTYSFAGQHPAGQNAIGEPFQTSVAPSTLPQPGAVPGAMPQHRMSLPDQLLNQQGQPFFSPPPLAKGGIPPPLPNRVMTPQQSVQAGQMPSPATKDAPGAASTPGATPGSLSASPVPRASSTAAPGTVPTQFPHLQHAQTMPATLPHHLAPHSHHSQATSLPPQPNPNQPYRPVQGQSVPGQPVQQPMIMGPNGVLIPLSQAYPYSATPQQVPQQPMQNQRPPQVQPQPQAYVPAAYIPGTTTTPASGAAAPAGIGSPHPASTYRPYTTANPAMNVGTAPARPAATSVASSSSSGSGLFSKLLKNPAVKRTAFAIGGALVGESIGLSGAAGARIGTSAYSSHQQYKRQSAQQAAIENAAQKAQANAAQAQQQQILAAQQQAVGGRPPLYPMHTAPGQLQQSASMPPRTPGAPTVPQPYIPGQPVTGQAMPVQGGRPNIPVSHSAPPGQMQHAPGTPYIPGQSSPGMRDTTNPAPGAAIGMAAGQDRATSGRPHGTTAGRGYNHNQRPPGATGMPPGHTAGRGRGAGPMPSAAGTTGAGRGAPTSNEQLANTVFNTLLDAHQHQHQQQQDPYSAILQQQQQQQNAFYNILSQQQQQQQQQQNSFYDILNQQQQQQQNSFYDILSQSQQTSFGIAAVTPAPVPVFDMNTNTQIDIDVTNNFTVDDGSGTGDWGGDGGNYGGDTGDFGSNIGGDLGGDF
ncbi:hypothetical protein SEPCBS57363_003264 [Sporothrix epigloea]|uniref:WW domain-containing protein n=1 Tax=Sporothrix epigloea TaxID=1892477 RepID=A0ABP0DKR5_9PEZI